MSFPRVEGDKEWLTDATALQVHQSSERDDVSAYPRIDRS